jgi:hypothetical protein
MSCYYLCTFILSFLCFSSCSSYRYNAFDLLGARDLAMEATRNVNNWIAKLEPWKMKDDKVHYCRIQQSASKTH